MVVALVRLRIVPLIVRPAGRVTSTTLLRARALGAVAVTTASMLAIIASEMSPMIAVRTALRVPE